MTQSKGLFDHNSSLGMADMTAIVWKWMVLLIFWCGDKLKNTKLCYN